MSKKSSKIIAGFSLKTREGFKKWLQHKVSSTSPIFQYFENLYIKETDKIKVFEIIYKNQPYEDKKIRYLDHELYICLKDFLTYEGLTKNPALEAYLVNNELIGKDSSLFVFHHNILQERIEALPYSIEKYFMEALSLQHAHRHAISKGIRDDSEFSHLALQNLENYYNIEKLRLYCVLINNEQVFISQTKNFENLIDKTIAEKNPVLQLYMDLYSLLNGKNVDINTLVVKTLGIYILLDVWYVKEIFIILQNFCIKKLKLGGKVYEKFLLDIYKIQIEKDILLHNQSLSPWTYKNIITIAFRLQEDQWAYSFMQEYIKYVSEDERQNVYSYNMANYFYRSKNYDKSQQILQTVEFTDTFYKLGAKWMLAKIYFEKEEWSVLEYHLQSFLHVLKRDRRLQREQKLPYINQIKYTTLIAKAYQQHISLKSLLRKLDFSIPLAENLWIEQQWTTFLEKKRYYYKMLKEESPSL